MVGSSQDRNPSGRRFEEKKRSLMRRSPQRDTRPKVKIRGYEANSARKACKKQYTAQEKVAYQKNKAGERNVREEELVALAWEVNYTVQAHAHKGVVDQKVVDKRKSDNECTRCGMKNHPWKYCRRPVLVSAVYRGQSKPKRQSSLTPTRCPLVATVAVNGQGESSRRAVQRPPAWAFEDDDIL